MSYPRAGRPITSSTACVALAWQGTLRRLVAGERVTPLPPGPTALLARANIVGAQHP